MTAACRWWWLAAVGWWAPGVAALAAYGWPENFVRETLDSPARPD